MANDSVTLTASPRTALGKKNRALRRSGQVPLHVYGLNTESASLQAPLEEVRRVLRTAGFTTPVTLNVDGKESVTMVRQLARHPVTEDLQHIDFLRVDPDKPIETRVPVVLINTNTAPGTRGGAGVVTQGLYEVHVRARPFDIPKQLIADCNKLDSPTSAIRVLELDYPAGVEPAGNLQQPIVWIQAPRVTKVETPEVAEGAVAEGAEGAAPAAGATPGAATPAAQAPAGGKKS